MSLDIVLKMTMPVTVHSGNISHSLKPMASLAGAGFLWEESMFGVQAEDLLPRIKAALYDLTTEPQNFAHLSTTDESGKIEDLIRFLKDLLEACRRHPVASVEAFT